MITPDPNADCPCCSHKPFNQCCQPLLTGQARADTAEALMRSRYSAFATGNIDYLIYTLHPDKRQPQDAQLLAEAMENCEWLALEVRSAEMGSEKLQQGSVEFVATYRQSGQLELLHERSSFVKENDYWYYVDGTLYSSPGKTIQKPGRNDPCWCGSNKKFKKCHGGN